MKISLCMIVRNESDNIERCLNSIYKAVDEIETSGNLFFVVYKISTDRK